MIGQETIPGSEYIKALEIYRRGDHEAFDGMDIDLQDEEIQHAIMQDIAFLDFNESEMLCPSHELIGDNFAELIPMPEATRQALKQHIESCGRCKAMVSELEKSTKKIAELAQPIIKEALKQYREKCSGEHEHGGSS